MRAVSSLPIFSRAIEVSGDPVPEPQSWMLMAAGAVGLVWRGRATLRPRSLRSANDGADAGYASDIPLPE